jgi:hypothetical protein
MNIYILQAKLFNNILTAEQIEYIQANNIFIYDDNIIIHNECGIPIIPINEITWVYDNNNYRIPYLNETKMSQLKINESYNIYDYISSAGLINNNHIICGDNFLSICDVFIGSINSIHANPNNVLLQKNCVNIEQDNICEIVNKYNKIFIKTDDLLYFYYKINNCDINMNNKTIISHNSDYEIDIKYLHFLNNVNIKKQYSQNCTISHIKLQPIPIGIENRQWLDHMIFHKIRLNDNIKKDKQIYFFFSLSTHFSRLECYEKLKNTLEWNQPLSKEEYFIELKRHKYAICPRGNGLDTHRIWECLYLNVIPIMLKTDFVGIDNLPIIYLNDWNELNITNLTDNFKNIQNSKLTIDFYNS